MLRNKILLVLGAGASYDYSFPTGYELTKIIHHQLEVGLEQRLTGIVGIIDILNEMGFEYPMIAEFRERIQELDLPTFDLWIQENKEFKDLAKAAIAAALIPFERDEAIREPNHPRKHWYRFLFQQMLGENADGGLGFQFSAHNLVILTFNYDRSLEYYFLNQLQKTYGKQALAFWYDLNIRHVYGLLGKPDFVGPDPNCRPFNPNVTKDAIRTCMNNMIMVTETRRPDDEYLLIKSFREADLVCFLGFGYAPQNINMLIPNRQILGNKAVYGSAYHLPEAKRREVTEQIPGIRLCDWDQDVLTVLERNRILF